MWEHDGAEELAGTATRLSFGGARSVEFHDRRCQTVGVEDVQWEAKVVADQARLAYAIIAFNLALTVARRAGMG